MGMHIFRLGPLKRSTDCCNWLRGLTCTSPGISSNIWLCALVGEQYWTPVAANKRNKWVSYEKNKYKCARKLEDKNSVWNSTKSNQFHFYYDQDTDLFLLLEIKRLPCHQAEIYITTWMRIFSTICTYHKTRNWSCETHQAISAHF